MSVEQQPWSCLLPGDPRRAEAAGDVLVMWRPDPAQLHDARRHRGLVLLDPRGIADGYLAQLGFHHVRRFGALPSLRQMRWLIPLGRSRVATGAVRALCTPYRLKGRVLAAGARAMASSGLPLWGHQVWVALREQPWLEAIVQNALGHDDVHLGLASGDWGLRRTPAVAAVDSSGRALAFAKLAGTPRAERLIRHEATILSELTARYPVHPLAPALLFAGEVEGRYVLVQSALPGRAVDLSLSSAHLAFLRRLSDSEQRPAGRTALVRSIDERIQLSPEIAPLFARARAILNDMTAPSTVTHGDFAPQNLRRSDDRLGAFDWENATLDGLPLVDLANHELQVGFMWRQRSVTQMLETVRRIAAQATLPRTQALALQAACLADVYLQRIEAGHHATAPATARYRELLGQVDRVMSEEDGP